MKTKSGKHGFRRLLCGLTALAAALVMLPASALAGQNSGPAVVQNGVTIDKGATNLDENDQTRVTLEIGSVQSENPVSDVVFVLDKSTSIDVVDAALAMLGELVNRAQNTDAIVNVGVVMFNNKGHTLLGLTELNKENMDSITSAFKTSMSDGTNMEAGIRKGIALLEEDTDVKPEDKHLVLVSDGVTYYWGDAQTVYTDLNNVIASSVDYMNNDAHGRSHDWNAYLNPVNWMNDAQANGIDNVIATYGVETRWNVDGTADYDLYHPGSQQYNNEILPDNILPADTLYTSLECAIYMAGRAWEDAAGAGYQLYAYGNDHYLKQYPWAPNFVRGMHLIGGTSELYTESSLDVRGMFDKVKNSILYEIQSGTVTDTIGNDFNWVGMDTLQLTVGGQAYTGTVTGNTVTYGVNLDGVAEYKVTYANNNGVETLTWDINVPVEAARGVTLSYALKVDPNSPTLPAAGTSGYLPTNVEAVLTYKPTDGTYRDEMEFPIPELPYGTPGGETSGDDDEEEEPDPDPVLPTTPTLSIRKVWVEDTEETRPDSIQVDIYHDEELYDTIEVEEKYRWRASYSIPERYENDDWWVQEADVPAGYEDYIDETRHNVFVITNTYTVEEEESSEESSETPAEPSQPSEYIPPESSEPSVEPSEPVSEPSEPSEPTLPQTGQLWWPVPVLLLCGAVAVASGALRSARRNRK